MKQRQKVGKPENGNVLMMPTTSMLHAGLARRRNQARKGLAMAIPLAAALVTRALPAFATEAFEDEPASEETKPKKSPTATQGAAPKEFLEETGGTDTSVSLKPRFLVSARTGFSLPLGSVAGGASEKPLDQLVLGQIPLQVDLGGRMGNLFVGGYAAMAANLLASKYDCNPLARCSSSSISFGLQIHYHLAPERPLNPWFGVGVGYELLQVRREDRVNDANYSQSVVHGPQLLKLMGGAEFRASSKFGVGPFAEISLGEYWNESSRLKTNQMDVATSDALVGKALHAWIGLGVRVTYFQ